MHLRPSLALIAVLSLASPLAAQDSPAGDTSAAPATEVISTGWSLKKPAAKGKTVRPVRAKASKTRTVRRDQQPRIFGGATAGNSRRTGTRGGAHVGVALPF